MRRPLLALAAVIALLPAGAVLATSYGPRTPHDPKLGCKAIKQVIADLNKGRLADPESSKAGPTFFSDLYGEVEEKEEAAFLHSMRHSEGKKDAEPIELRDVALVHKDKEDPIYLVMLDRKAWHETREVYLDDGLSETVDDPGYVTDTSYWLVSFISNGITDFREAPEMFRLWDEDASLKDCY